MKTKKHIAEYAQLALNDEISAAQSVRKRLAAAINGLDGHDPATLIKLGSDVARAIATLDWRLRMMGIRKTQFAKALEDEGGEEKRPGPTTNNQELPPPPVKQSATTKGLAT